MFAFELLTFSLGLIGTVLGAINTYDLIQKNLVRVKICASITTLLPNGNRYFCNVKRFQERPAQEKADMLENGQILLTIRNYSAFTIYIASVGFTRHNWLKILNTDTVTILNPYIINASATTMENTRHLKTPRTQQVVYSLYPIAVSSRDSIDILCPSATVSLALSNECNAASMTTACGKTRTGSAKAILGLFGSQKPDDKKNEDVVQIKRNH